MTQTNKKNKVPPTHVKHKVMKPKIKAVRIREIKLDKISSKHKIKKTNSKASAKKSFGFATQHFYIYILHTLPIIYHK